MSQYIDIDTFINAVIIGLVVLGIVIGLILAGTDPMNEE